MIESFFLNSEEMRLRRIRQRVRMLVDLAGDRGQTGAVEGRWAIAMLSYATVGSDKPKDLSAFLDCVRHWAGRRGFKLCYCWVAELQKRGALHYHVMFKLPKGVKLPMPDESGWWKHGSSNIDWVRKSGKRYLSKYASKGSEGRGVFRRGLRMCGCGGLPAHARAWFSWLLKPHYCKAECDPQDSPKKVAGGVVVRSTGQFIPTPYDCTPVPELGGIILTPRTVDSWARAGVDPQPVKTYSLRESLKAAWASYKGFKWGFCGESIGGLAWPFAES